MYQFKKSIAIALIIAVTIVSSCPRRADSILPLAAAAAAVGVSEAGLIAYSTALLAAGGMAVNNALAQRKAATVAAEMGWSEETKAAYRDAFDGMDEDGNFQLFVTPGMVEDIMRAKTAINEAIEDGEPITYQETGEEEVITIPFGEIQLGGVEGILTCLADWAMDPDYGHTLRIYVKGSNYMHGWTGLKVWSACEDKSLTASGQHEVYLKYAVYEDNVNISGDVILETLYCGSTSASYVWNLGVQYFNEHSFGAAVYDGEASLFVDGEMVYNLADVGSDYGLQEMEGTGEVSPAIPFIYSMDYVGEGVLSPSDVDETPMTPAELAGLAGTTIGGTVAVPVGGTVALPTPVTWPSTFDLTGVIGALQNVWNAITQGFAGVQAKLAEIVGAIGGSVDPNFFDGFFDGFTGLIGDKIPELPDLDTTTMTEPEWNWSVTINYPMTHTFEILSASTINTYRPTIKGWTSGVLILLTTLYLYRKIPMIVKG